MDQTQTNLRKMVSNIFRMSGLSLARESMKYILEFLQEYPPELQETWIDKILDKVQRQRLMDTLIRIDCMELAVKECRKGDNYTREDILNIINAFDVPKLSYDNERKNFSIVTKPSKIVSDVKEKPKIFHERYTIVLQRTLHNKLFSPSLYAGYDYSFGKSKFRVRTVEYLLASASKTEGLLVLGMITQLKEGKYYLEDPTGLVLMSLNKTDFQSGLFTENCFVLAEGYYYNGLFRVKTLGLPPPEETNATRAYYGSINFFGGPSTSLNRERLELIERQKEETMFVFLSDVYLDLQVTFEKLRVLFQGYSELRPMLFIFMGNYLSQPAGVKSVFQLRDGLHNLANVILEFPTLAQDSTFIFIPGPEDPGFVNILPRPPFVDVITEPMKRKLPNAVFATNPCRIKYCTKEIVIFRDDVYTKMCRTAIRFPENEDTVDHFVKTIISQNHLCPVPLHVTTVYWEYDHALNLYPLPNLTVIGDKAKPFTVARNSCIFTNTGSFSRSKFCFKTYTPFENKVEDCQLPTE